MASPTLERPPDFLKDTFCGAADRLNESKRPNSYRVLSDPADVESPGTALTANTAQSDTLGTVFDIDVFTFDAVKVVRVPQSLGLAVDGRSGEGVIYLR